MNLTLETVNILFFLIPGFLSSYIIDGIIVRGELSSVKRIVESLIFTFLIYIIVSFFVNIELFAYLASKDGNTSFKFSTNPKFLILLLLISIILPIIIGSILFYDIHMKVLRWCKITNKTSRNTVWQDVFIEQKSFVVVHFKDERRICGWPLYYSNVPKEGFIYICDPSWIDDNNQYLECGTHGILIKSEDVNFIEFLNNSGEEKNAK